MMIKNDFNFNTFNFNLSNKKLFRNEQIFSTNSTLNSQKIGTPTFKKNFIYSPDLNISFGESNEKSYEKKEQLIELSGFSTNKNNKTNEELLKKIEVLATENRTIESEKEFWRINFENLRRKFEILNKENSDKKSKKILNSSTFSKNLKKKSEECYYNQIKKLEAEIKLWRTKYEEVKKDYYEISKKKKDNNFNFRFLFFFINFC